jgi:hypothetical protein
MRLSALFFVLVLFFLLPTQGLAQTAQFVAEAQALFQSTGFEIRLEGGPVQSNGYRSQVNTNALLSVLGRDPSRFEAFAQLAQSISRLPDLPASHWLLDGLHQFLGRLERQPDSVPAPIRERIARGILDEVLSNVSRGWLEAFPLGAPARWRAGVALPAFLLPELRRHPEWLGSTSLVDQSSFRGLSRLLNRADFSRLSSLPGQSGRIGADWVLLLGSGRAADILLLVEGARRSPELATSLLARLGSRNWVPEGVALNQWIGVLSGIIPTVSELAGSGVSNQWPDLLDRLLLLPGAERSFEVVRHNLSSQVEALRNLSDHSRGSIHRLLAVLDRRPLGERAQVAPWQESRERQVSLIEQEGPAWIESLRNDPALRAGWLATFQETLSTLWGYRERLGLARWARLLSPYSRELPELSQTIQSLLTSRSPGERQLALAEALAPWIERAPELRRTLLNQLQDLPSLPANAWLRARLAVALGGGRVGSLVPERVIADLAALGDREALLTFGSDFTSEQAMGRMIEALVSSTQRSSGEAQWLSNRFRARVLESPEALRALFEHWLESRSILTQNHEGDAIERFLLSALDSSPELIHRYLRALEAISATSASMGAVAVTRAPGFSAAGPMAIADQEGMRIKGVLQRNLPTVIRALLRNPIQPSRVQWILAHWPTIQGSEELRALLAERIREFDPQSEERWAESPIRDLFLRSLASPSLAIRQAAILALESLSSRPSMGVQQSGNAGPLVAPNRSSRDLEAAANTRNSQRTALSVEILGDATIQRSLLSSSRESAQYFPNLARRLFALSRAQPPANSSVAFEIGRHEAALQSRGNSASIWGCTLREAAYRLTQGSTQGIQLP